MNKKIYVKDLSNYIGQEIIFDGFVDKIKDLKGVQFIVLRDSTGKVQATITKSEENERLNKVVQGLTPESTVRIKGILNKSEYVKLLGIEIIPSDIIITSLAEKLPINYKDESMTRSIRHDYRQLDLRLDKNNYVFKIETEFENALRSFCVKNGYIELHSPKITAKPAESGSEVFKFNYFGQEAALAQSPQFYKQMAMVAGFDKVFEIGPAFRAEKSDTNCHASEINMCDLELSWIYDISQLETEEEEFLKNGFEAINSSYGDVIKNVFKSKLVNPDIRFPKINFYEAKRILKDKYNYNSDRSGDFDRKEELLLGKYALETYNSDFIFVENFPFASRTFYQKIDENRDTKSFDLLYRGLEITTGSLREHNYSQLISQINDKGLNADELKNYLELFKYGCPPHGGCGTGLSRVLMKTLNIDNIMDTSFIYRGCTRKLKL